MHNWSLIWWKIHSLSFTIQNCILEGSYLLKIFSQHWRPVLGTRGAASGSVAESGSLWDTA